MFIQHSQKTIYEKLIDYLQVTLLFILSSILTLFIGTGAALSATFITVYKMQTDIVDTSIYQTYKQQFKLTFLSSTYTFLGSVLLFGGAGYFIVYRLPADYPMRFPLGVLTAVYGALFMQYAFPIISVFKHSGPLHLIKNTLLLMHLHPLTSLSLLINALTFYALVFMVHPVLTIPAFLLVFYVQGNVFRPIIKIYVARLSGKEETEETIEE